MGPVLHNKPLTCSLVSQSTSRLSLSQSPTGRPACFPRPVSIKSGLSPAFVQLCEQGRAMLFTVGYSHRECNFKCTDSLELVSVEKGDRAGEIVQWLETLLALLKDQGLIPCSHTVTHS